MTTTRQVSSTKARAFSQAQRAEILERDDWRCRVCGVDAKALHDDLQARRRAILRSTLWQCSTGRERYALVAREMGADVHNVEAVLRHNRIPAEVDHIIPRALGGLSVPANGRTLCCGCHKAKSADDAKAIARTPSKLVARDAKSG